MQQIRQRLTYANVMSSLAVFLVLAGATAFAARVARHSVGTAQLKANAVTTAKLKRNAVTTRKIAKNAVTTAKLRDAAVTGDKVAVSTLGEVPSAREAKLLDGIGATAFARQASSATDNALEGVSGTARTASIVAPQKGFLLAIASGDVYNDGPTGASTECRLNLDSEDIAASKRSGYVSEEVPRNVCATNAIVPVAAGEHVVAFTFAVVPPEGGVEAAELDLVFVPFEG
jgi:hypothetical protein